jgi:hypothetical protein
MTRGRTQASLACASVLLGLAAGAAPAAGQPCWQSLPPGVIGYAHTQFGVPVGFDVQGDYAYVADHRSGGNNGSETGVLQIFNVSNPCSPVSRGSVANPGAETADVAVHGDYAYAAGDTSGLVVYDIQDPDHPFEVSRRNDAAYAQTLFHDGGTKVYVNYIYSPGRQLAIYDVTTPTSLPPPSLYSNNSEWPSASHGWSIRVVGDRAYQFLTNGSPHLEIVDVSNPSAPVHVGGMAWNALAQYGDLGQLRRLGNYLYWSASPIEPPAGSVAGGLRVVDISNEASPHVVAQLDLADAGYAYWKGGGLDLVGSRALVVGRSGLHVIDVSDPLHPAETGLFPYPEGFAPFGGLVKAVGDLAYVSAMAAYWKPTYQPTQGGLAIFKLDLHGPMADDLTASPSPASVSTQLTLRATVTDSDTGGSAIASAQYRINGGAWTAMTAQDGAFDSAVENVEASFTAPSTPGVFDVCVRATDTWRNNGAETCATLVVYDPAGAFATGGGWIDSPAGAYTRDPSFTGKASFGFVAKYQKKAAAPTGQLQFKAADLSFHSTSYEWLAVAGAQAQLAGWGTVKGKGRYRFSLTAIDGDASVSDGYGGDRFRIRIWSDSAGVAYDNALGDALATTELGGGSIVIHAK